MPKKSIPADWSREVRVSDISEMKHQLFIVNRKVNVLLVISAVEAMVLFMHSR